MRGSDHRFAGSEPHKTFKALPIWSRLVPLIPKVGKFSVQRLPIQVAFFRWVRLFGGESPHRTGRGNGQPEGKGVLREVESGIAVASIGAPGIPSAGMVTMVMVLQSVGLPAQAIAILIPIDRPLDAIRTAVNVEGDAICSIIVQNSISKNKSPK